MFSVYLYKYKEIKFDYKIFRDEQLITTGYTKLIFLNAKTNKPMRCPSSIIEAIKKV